jgi:uncharacterized cupredoxin-like copper-binding protein
MRKALGLSILAALLVVGTAAGIFTARSGATTAKTRVTVVATDYHFGLSRRSAPVGIVLFKVVNKGKVSHNFFIHGKITKTLNPGQSQTLRVVFAKKGKYAYICAILGHAKLGMKGVFAVGVKPPPITTQTTTTTTATTTTQTTTTTTGTVGGANTTVQVGMFEYRFDLSQSTIPSGQVTFVITNKGTEVHNFSIVGVKNGTLLSPGQSETWTVALPAKAYTYQCDVPFHVDRGMVGQFTVTP